MKLLVALGLLAGAAQVLALVWLARLAYQFAQYQGWLR